MLPKVHRFTRDNFELFRKRMESFRTRDFLFLYSPSRNFPPKYAVVISKKADKRAVKRNAFRRKVYALFREKLLDSKIPFNVICLYKGSSIPDNSGDLDLAVESFVNYLKK